MPFKLEHYDRVKAEFQERNEIFKEFFNYFELTWVKGQYFTLTDWNYCIALNETELSVELSKNFHITNNAVESCNAILNSCLHRGKIMNFFSNRYLFILMIKGKISAVTFREIFIF